MSVYFPQASVILRVIFEDFKGNVPTADLKTIYALPIVARDVTVNINDYTHADTFQMEIDYKNFPFDPRCIRSCGVSIFIQDMGTVYNTDNSLNLIKPGPENIVFQGFADEDSISFDEEHRVVKMEGRDFTALLADKRAPAKPFPLNVPLDVAIKALLIANPDLTEIKVENRTNETLPTIAEFAPNFTPQATAKNPKPNENLWDLIQELVARAALICYIEIDKLVITKPRILYGRDTTKQFIYGQNLSNLEFKRKLGRKKGFNIRTVSLDFKTKQAIEAKIPLESTEAWSDDIDIDQEEVSIPQMNSDGSPGDPKPAPYITFRFPNMTKKQLIEVGQKIFEEVGRQQIEGSLTTKEMDLTDAGAKCFNATLMRIGTPIEIHIDQGDMAGLSNLKTVAERKQFLLDRCYDSKVAQAFAQTLNRFHTKFYTKAVTFTVNQETGFKMKVDFINFIELDNKGLGIG